MSPIKVEIFRPQGGSIAFKLLNPDDNEKNISMAAGRWLHELYVIECYDNNRGINLYTRDLTYEFGDGLRLKVSDKEGIGDVIEFSVASGADRAKALERVPDLMGGVGISDATTLDQIRAAVAQALKEGSSPGH